MGNFQTAYSLAILQKRASAAMQQTLMAIATVSGAAKALRPIY
jgi:hypothetical protein